MTRIHRDAIAGEMSAHRASLHTALEELASKAGTLALIADLLVETLQSGHKILVAGNGGSAAESQHFSAELVGRFRRERPPYAVLALTTDSSILTAVGNDYSFAQVFSRQVEALGRAGDVLLTFSTSGESENLVQAVEAARRNNVATIAVTGPKPNRLARVADHALMLPGLDTPIVQELQMMVTHLLCGIIEDELSGMTTMV